MAIIKVLSSRATPQKLVNYLTQEEKTETKLISGKDCDPETIAKEFRATKELYNKTDGVQYHHMIQSFSPKDNITPEKAHELGKELAEKQFKGYEVFIVTHQDKKHIHNHLVVNSVSFENGKKYQSNRNSMIELKRESNRQCETEGLIVLDIEHRASQRITTGEKRIDMKGGIPWKDELRQCIDFAKERTNNFPEFKECLKKNFEIDTRITNKIISYQHPEKGNPIRGSKLGTNYDKEELQNEFNRKEKSINRRRTEPSNRGEGNRRNEGFELSWNKSEIGTPTSRADSNKQQNTKSNGPKRDGQSGIIEETRGEPQIKVGNRREGKQHIQRNESRDKGIERKQLSEVRKDSQGSIGGTGKEQRASEGAYKEHTRLSTSSKEYTKPELEGEGKTILNTTTSNNRNDSLNNRSISTSNPLDEIVKALGSSIEKALNEEKELADREKRKLEKQKIRPKKSKEQGLER